MTICKCKKCGETIITTEHIEDKRNALCKRCSLKHKKKKEVKN